MKKLEALIQTRSDILAWMKNLEATLEKEERDMTPEESQDFDEKTQTLESLKPQIRRLEQLKAENQAQDQIQHEKRMTALSSMPSIQIQRKHPQAQEVNPDQLVSLRSLAGGGELDVTRDQLIRARPTDKRAVQVYFPSTGANTATANLFESLTPWTALQENLGFRVLDGVAEKRIIVGGRSSDGTYVGETGASIERTAAMSRKILSPFVLRAHALVSSTYMATDEVGATNWVVAELQRGLIRGLEAKMFSVDAAVSNVSPAGLFADLTPQVPSSWDGAAVKGLWDEMAANGMDIQTALFICSPSVLSTLMNTSIDTGSGIRVVQNGQLSIFGNRVVATSKIAATGAAFVAPLQVVLGNFGARLVVDPYTSAKDGQIEYVAELWHDFTLVDDNGASYGATA